MRNGFFTAGNWVVDKIKMIDQYPTSGHLANINRMISSGGGVFNTAVDLAIMNPKLPVYATGVVGSDSEGNFLKQALQKVGITVDFTNSADQPTSFTDVMTEIDSGARTFFHSRGANAQLTMEQIVANNNSAKIFHLAYLLALDELDKPDVEYDVVAARLFKIIQQSGYKTSADVISESGNRFQKVVNPCLKYLDYLIINEIEAGAIAGIEIRQADDTINDDMLKKATEKLFELGVNDTVIVHFPEGAYGVNRSGEKALVKSAHVESKDIIGTVGAGDAFCAGALYGLHEELPLKKVVQIANTSARFNLFSASGTGGAVAIEEIYKFTNVYYGE